MVGAVTSTTRRTVRFSPSLAINARRFSSTVSPLASFRPLTASAFDALAASAAFATSAAKPRKSSPRATKSVSLFTSTSTPVLPSADFSMTTTPSAATREAFLSALARPDLRMFSAAASRSPFASTSAFLHSIMPAPVRSRSCLTASAGMFIRSYLVEKVDQPRRGPPPPPPRPRPGALPVPVRERPALAVALRGAASPVSVNTAGSAPSSGSAATLATTGRRRECGVGRTATDAAAAAPSAVPCARPSCAECRSRRARRTRLRPRRRPGPANGLR